MPRHPDFQKIYKKYIATYKTEEKGRTLYYAWLNKKGYSEEKPFPGKDKKKEHKEMPCTVVGFELKETETEYHIEGLIATSHIDKSDEIGENGIPDVIPKETLESFANQINTLERARRMGVHHSEGRPINAEFFGKADVDVTPASVIQLTDGEWGLWGDTKLLKADEKTPEIISQIESGELNSHSITYDTNDFDTTEFEWYGDNLVRVLTPDTQLFGYTLASKPVNENAAILGYGFKEFKELVNDEKLNTRKDGSKRGTNMTGEPKNPQDQVDAGVTPPVKDAGGKDTVVDASKDTTKVDASKDTTKVDASAPAGEDAEMKEFMAYKAQKKEFERKELIGKTVDAAVGVAISKLDVKEKVLKDTGKPGELKEVSLEIKEFMEVISDPKELEVKEQFRRAAAVLDHVERNWQDMYTKSAEAREFKSFGVNGRHLEFKGLGINTNQNTDADYLQSSAELQDIYDPIIYNALNQDTVTWNLFAKDDFSKKGNNQVQFTLKIAANESVGFYTGNAVTTGNVTRLKYQTKFKKLQVGVSVDGDMIAAARGGPVNDVFAQEVMDSTMDMMSVLNAALFAETGLETAAEPIGLEYITDSAGNTSLYSLTRSAANKLAPDAAGDTYIDGSAATVTYANLRAAKRQAILEGAKKNKLVFITNPVQADIVRGIEDTNRRHYTDRDTRFGFSTDLYIDGIPVFEDKDCNTDDWFLVDLETHRVAIWVPPTIERLGKSSDSEAAFIKTYFAMYNRAPRRMVQVYNNAVA